MENSEYKKSFHLKFQETAGLAVYNTGEQQCPPNYSCGPAVWNYYLLHFVVSGKGTFTSMGKTFDIKAGDAFLISPSEIFEYTADSDDPWKYCWVAFQGADAKRLTSLTSLSPENPVISYSNEDGEIIHNNITDIYSGVGSSAQNEVYMVGHLYLLLSNMIGMAKVNGSSQTAGRQYLKLGLKYIQNNYNRKIAVEDIAAYANISPSHLYRIFIQEQGISPNRYLTEYRVNEACGLIRQGCYSMGEVANSVGFEDPLYFSRVFKKIKMVSPTNYQTKYAQVSQELLD